MSRKSSRIVTFYSFKGGVGRTMALANIGVLLARRGNKVLMVDFDLEAPGLLEYFRDALPADCGERRGVADLLDGAFRCGTSKGPGAYDDLDLEGCFQEASVGGTTVSLLSSGSQTTDYYDRILGFDWATFFSVHGGGAFFEWLRRALHERFDFVLIDSRTGITDIGGICTVQLPDILVPVFVTNEQSVQGVVNVVRSAHAARQQLVYDRSRMLVYPLLSRFESRTQYHEAQQWLDDLARRLAPMYDSWVPEGVSYRAVLEQTKVPYHAIFSFGESLPVLDGISDPESLGYAYAASASLLESDFTSIAELVTDAGSRSEGAAASSVALADADQYVDDLPASLKEDLLQLLSRMLPTVADARPKVDFGELSSIPVRVVADLCGLGVLERDDRTFWLRDAVSSGRWALLRSVQRDLANVIRFRSSLHKTMVDPAAILTGATLAHAQALLLEAPLAFTPDEVAFVRLSERLAQKAPDRQPVSQLSMRTIVLALLVAVLSGAIAPMFFWGVDSVWVGAVAFAIVLLAGVGVSLLEWAAGKSITLRLTVADPRLAQRALLRDAANRGFKVTLESGGMTYLSRAGGGPSSAIGRLRAFLGVRSADAQLVVLAMKEDGVDVLSFTGPRATVDPITRRLRKLGLLELRPVRARPGP